MSSDRTAAIERTIAELEAQGISWTNKQVYAQVGGQYAALSQYLKQRRARGPDATVVAAASVVPDQTAVEAAQARLAACEAAHAQAVQGVMAARGGVLEVAAQDLALRHALQLKLLYPLEEHDTAMQKALATAHERYQAACAVAQARTVALEHAQAALATAQTEATEARQRAWLAVHHGDLLATWDHEQQVLARTVDRAARIIQQQRVREFRQQVQEALGEMSTAAD